VDRSCSVRAHLRTQIIGTILRKTHKSDGKSYYSREQGSELIGARAQNNNREGGEPYKFSLKQNNRI
jgi:hypothetical protein